MSSDSGSPVCRASDLLAEVGAGMGRVEAAVRRRVVGQAEAVELMQVALLCGGHVLFVGLPGLAKTLLVQTLADTLALRFRRIQFTPDLMPQDITGGEVMETSADGRRHFRFCPGPVFCNVLLADEINRTPPKTQAALLQAMGEREVTAGGQTYPLAAPFHVFATQNPIEQEGTYPLPEAQLDRFMMMLKVGYPSEAEEVEIVRRSAVAPRGGEGMGGDESGESKAEAVLDAACLMRFASWAPKVPLAPPLLQAAVSMVRRTRPDEGGAPAVVRQYVAFGAGPRAAVHLVAAAQARALLQGRAAAEHQDLVALAAPILRHRLVLNFEAQRADISADMLVAAVVAASLG